MMSCPLHDEPVVEAYYAHGPRGSAGCFMADQDGTIIQAPPIWRHYIGMDYRALERKGTFTLVKKLVSAGKCSLN